MSCIFALKVHVMKYSSRQCALVQRHFCIQGWFILRTQSQSLCNYSLVGLGFGRNAKSGESRFFPDDVKTDIYQGNVWKELSSTGFLSHINSLAVMLNVDWFRPHKHSPGSVGVLYLVLLSLPRHERYKLENIIVVGILPRPSAPKLTANTFLEPLVRELQTGPAKNASPFMVVYLNAQSKSVLFVFHRISQLQGKLEDSLVT